MNDTERQFILQKLRQSIWCFKDISNNMPTRGWAISHQDKIMSIMTSIADLYGELLTPEEKQGLKLQHQDSVSQAKGIIHFLEKKFGKQS